MGDAVPLAYFISFRAYGTWLHGDERGSVDRFHNQYGTEFLPPDEDWRRQDDRLLKHPPVVLTQDQRHSVECAIREACLSRQWLLRALNVRTNHIHIVVSTNTNRPELALNAFKAKATRQLRCDGLWRHEHSPWSDRGSERYLWTELSIERAIDYVVKRTRPDGTNCDLAGGGSSVCCGCGCCGTASVVVLACVLGCTGAGLLAQHRPTRWSQVVLLPLVHLLVVVLLLLVAGQWMATTDLRCCC